MSNMSYCRFRNTAKDFRDCLQAEREHGYSEKGSQEEWEMKNPEPKPEDFDTEREYERAYDRWDAERDNLLPREENQARKWMIDMMADYLQELGFTVTGNGYQDHHEKASAGLK